MSHCLFYCRSLHTGTDGTGSETTEQVAYQPQPQPGLDYSLQRRDTSVYPHMIPSAHIQSMFSTIKHYLNQQINSFYFRYRQPASTACKQSKCLQQL